MLRRALIPMAVEHDTSYGPHAPSDMRELVADMREKGMEVDNPVWTVGRLDQRRHPNGNGNGRAPQPPAPPQEP